MTDRQDFRIEMLALQMPWRNKDLASVIFQLWQLSDYHGCEISFVVYYYIFQPERAPYPRLICCVRKGAARKAFACRSLSRLSGPEASTRLSARSTSQNLSEAERHLSFVSIKRAKLSSIAVPRLSWNYPTAKILFSHSLEAFKHVTWSLTETAWSLPSSLRGRYFQWFNHPQTLNHERLTTQ